MTSAVQPADQTGYDARTIVGSGVKLGIVTTVGVVVFALLSRAIGGTTEVVVQSILVLLGGLVFSFLAAMWLKPYDVDSIAWTALVGLLGALTFTVLDTAILRPLNLYHWTWDQIGGGSGFWYIPVWWMGAATLAWLGAWIYSLASRGATVGFGTLAGRPVVIALALFVLLGLTRIGPFTAAMMALAFCLALVVEVVVASVLSRK